MGNLGSCRRRTGIAQSGIDVLVSPGGPNGLAEAISEQFVDTFNTFVGDPLGELAQQYNLPHSIPLAGDDLATIFGLSTEMAQHVSDVALGVVSSMEELQTEVVGAGFTVISFLTEAERAALDPDTYTDFFRGVQTWVLDIPDTVTDIVEDGTEAFEELSGRVPSGQMTASADVTVTLTVGVDAYGFYVKAGDIVDADFDFSGNISVAGGAITGTADVDLSGSVGLTSPHADGLVRITDVDPSAATLIDFDLSGDADLNLGINVSLDTPCGDDALEFSGRWLWDVLTGGAQAAAGAAGFNLDELLDDTAAMAGQMINAYVTGVHDTFMGLTELPVIGEGLLEPLYSIFEDNFDYQNDLPTAREYLAPAGIEVLAEATPEQLYDSLIDPQIDLPEEILRLRISRSVSDSTGVSADGEADFDVGSAAVDLNLEGALAGSTRMDFEVYFGSSH